MRFSAGTVSHEKQKEETWRRRNEIGSTFVGIGREYLKKQSQ